MSIQWGTWDYSGGNGLRVGLDFSMSSSTTIVIKYWLECEYAYSGDVMTITETGWYSGSDGFTFTASAGSQTLIATHNRVNSSPGTTYSFGASVSGSYNGSQPSVSASYAVPAVVPSTPGVPSLSSFTTSGAHATWTAPSNWGGNVGTYDLQYAKDSGFTAGNGLVTHSGITSTSDDVTGCTPNTTEYVHVRAVNSAGASGWSGYVSFTTLPNPPAAPGTPTVTRTSDTQHGLTWTTNATTAAPYGSQKILRSTDGGSYATVATVSGSATSYTDTSTSADHRYTWQVQAVNAAGAAAPAASAAWQTTPAAPTNAVATKTPAGDITITWTNTTRLTATTSLEVQHSTDGGTTWAALATLSSGTTTTYTHTAPGTSTSHTYQVRADSTVGATLYSGFAVSNTVSTPTPPNAPSGMNPNGGYTDLANPTILTWVHNPTDGSTQSAFEVQHRVAGGSTWTTTGQTTSGASSWTLPGGTYANGQTVEWQVRTWGQLTGSADYSPWSASATIQGSSTPTVTISSPTAGTVTGSSSVTVTWAYFQAESVAQAAWKVTLLDGGGTVLTILSGTGTASTATLDGLTNGASYTIEVDTQSATGLWAASATVAVTFSFAPPANVDVIATFDVASGAITVSLYPEAYDGTTTLQQTGAYIQRSVDGGLTWVRLNSSPLDPAATVLDTTAPTDGSALYRVIALSSAPSQSTGTPAQVDTGSTVWCYLSTSDGYSTVTRMRQSVLTTRSVQLDQATQYFEGRALPVLYSGTAVTSSLAVSALLMDDSSTSGDLEALELTPGPFLWRDPTGRAMFAGMSGLQVQERAFPAVDAASFTLTEVDH